MYQKKFKLIFQIFINEMIVLNYFVIWQYLKIVELQSICWNISLNNEIWSILILKKFYFENLYDFLKLSVEKNLKINKRLKFCLNIDIAIVNMHSNCTKYIIWIMQKISLNLLLIIVYDDI